MGGGVPVDGIPPHRGLVSVQRAGFRSGHPHLHGRAGGSRGVRGKEIVGMLMLSRQSRRPEPGAGRDRGGIRASRGSSSRRRRDR